jgi:hypothetical protein
MGIKIKSIFHFCHVSSCDCLNHTSLSPFFLFFSFSLSLSLSLLPLSILFFFLFSSPSHARLSSLLSPLSPVSLSPSPSLSFSFSSSSLLRHTLEPAREMQWSRERASRVDADRDWDRLRCEDGEVDGPWGFGYG